MTAILDKKELKMLLIELAAEDPTFFKSLLQESEESIKKARRERLDKIIDNDFERYDDVFKDLA